MIRQTPARRAALLVAALGPTAGCYTRQPLLGPPDPGTEVVVTLNDRGRTALADSLGQNPDRVQGRVVARTDSSLVVSVSRVQAIGDREGTAWTGERATFRTSSLRAIEARRLSRGRSIAVAAIAGASLVALAITRGLTGSGGPGVDPGPGGPGQTQ